MKLPEKKIETVNIKIGEYDLVFKKATLNDSVLVNQFAKEHGQDNPIITIKILAMLLHGYENSQEEKEDFLSGLEVEDIGNMNNLLSKLGIKTEDSKKK